MRASGEIGKRSPDNSRRGWNGLGRMAKLVDATALGAVGATRGGSSPLPPTHRDGELSGSRKGWRFNSSLAQPCSPASGWGNPYPIYGGARSKTERRRGSSSGVEHHVANVRVVPTEARQTTRCSSGCSSGVEHHVANVRVVGSNPITRSFLTASVGISRSIFGLLTGRSFTG